MQELRPEQASTLLQVTLPALKTEHRITKRIIEAIPLDKGDYRPEPCAKTALELAWHIASAENMFLKVPAAGEFNFTGAPPESMHTSSDIAQWYANEFAVNFDRLTRLSPEQLCKVIEFRGIFHLPAVMYLEVGLKHSIHHRGQLSVYLRPMGGKVPSIYGESYDDKQARMATQASS
ncbi:MAG TPA: DinB family protein [Bryobacteraceae bacterium]|jgi:uncharacterized damage-inducible protein DinB|nr:DinB family protein [Bryobacteraceae bacterium]